MTISNEELMERARAVRLRAHAPYSGYWVGSALVDENGRVHVGCNVENTALPQGSCAEANALAAMVAAGGHRVVRIAVAGGSGKAEGLEACTPCGGCRQRIFEFGEPATEVIVLGEDGKLVSYRFEELLPRIMKPI